MRFWSFLKMKNDLLVNKKKYNIYLYFHISIAILYFIFFMIFFIKDDNNISNSSFRSKGYLFLSHSIINIIIARLISKKISWTYILLNVIGGLLTISIIYMLVKILMIYTNVLVVNFSLLIYSVVLVLMILYLYFLNRNTVKPTGENIEEIGKTQ